MPLNILVRGRMVVLPCADVQRRTSAGGLRTSVAGASGWLMLVSTPLRADCGTPLFYAMLVDYSDGAD